MEAIREQVSGKTQAEVMTDGELNFFVGGSVLDGDCNKVACKYSKLCWLVPAYCTSEEMHHIRNGLVSSVLRYGYLNPLHRMNFLQRVKPRFAERIEAAYADALNEEMSLDQRMWQALGTFHESCQGFPPIIRFLLDRVKERMDGNFARGSGEVVSRGSRKDIPDDPCADILTNSVEPGAFVVVHRKKRNKPKVRLLRDFSHTKCGPTRHPGFP